MVVDRVSSAKHWAVHLRPPPQPWCAAPAPRSLSSTRPTTAAAPNPPHAGPQRRKRAHQAPPRGLGFTTTALRLLGFREQGELVRPVISRFSRPAPNRDPARFPRPTLGPPSPKQLQVEARAAAHVLGRPPTSRFFGERPPRQASIKPFLRGKEGESPHLAQGGAIGRGGGRALSSGRGKKLGPAHFLPFAGGRWCCPPHRRHPGIGRPRAAPGRADGSPSVFPISGPRRGPLGVTKGLPALLAGIRKGPTSPPTVGYAKNANVP